MSKKDYTGAIAAIVPVGDHREVEIIFPDVDPARASGIEYGEVVHVMVRESVDKSLYFIDAQALDIVTDTQTGIVAVRLLVFPAGTPELVAVYPENNQHVIDNAEELRERGTLFAL